jgi:hypothetical protein
MSVLAYSSISGLRVGSKAFKIGSMSSRFGIPTALTLFVTLLTAQFFADPSRADSPDSPKTILYIGDSHSVGTFGNELDLLLRQKFGDAHVESYGSCGSSPSWWMSGKATSCGYKERHPHNKSKQTQKHSTPKLPKLLIDDKPDHLVIAMGGNLLKSSEEAAVREIKNFLTQIRALGVSSCTWIGPPQGWKRPSNTLDLLRAYEAEITPFCTFINSYEFEYLRIPKGKGDGIHYDSFSGGPALAKRWAIDVALKIKGVDPSGVR